MIPPLTDEQRQAVARYRDTLYDVALTAATTYHRRLEEQGIPPEHIAAPFLAALYGAAEEYMRLGGAEDFAKALHNAVQSAARRFHFEIVESN
jgi:hypothetical protein